MTSHLRLYDVVFDVICPLGMPLGMCKCGHREIQFRGYKKFMYNSAGHEILNAQKYKSISIFGIFQAQISLEFYFSAHKS